MSTPNDFDILLVGFNESLKLALRSIISGFKIKSINSADEVESFIENYQLKPGSVVLVSHYLEGITHYEIAQAFGSCFDGIKLIFLTQDRTYFDVDELKKNGFPESFILPNDYMYLTNFIEDYRLDSLGHGSKRYTAIKLIDITPGEELPFTVKAYLPMNDKYILLTASGELSEKKYKTLNSVRSGSVYIESKQIDKFYDFVADKLIKLGKSSNDSVSATEKAQRLNLAVRTLFRNVLSVSDSETSFDSGRDLLDQSKKIVESYVQKVTGLDLNEKLKMIMGESSDAYLHAQTVSTLACLFSMAIGVGQPEDLAIAGLFHDLGIHGISKDVSVFNYNELSEEEIKQYQQHPKLSLSHLKEKKVTLTPEIAEIIEKHHERPDGNGFPSRLPAHKIPPTAQLLAYSDAFEYLSRPIPGQPTPNPMAIHKQISERLNITPEILIKIEQFLASASI